MSPHNVLHAAPLEARSRAFLPPTLLSILPRLRLLLQTSTQLQSMSQSLATYAFCVPPPPCGLLVASCCCKSAKRRPLSHRARFRSSHTFSLTFHVAVPPPLLFCIFCPLCLQVQQTSADASYLARHVALRSGVSIPVPALTVNRLCGSGFEAVVQASKDILLGEAGLVLAGASRCTRAHLLFSFSFSFKFKFLSMLLFLLLLEPITNTLFPICTAPPLTVPGGAL